MHPWREGAGGPAPGGTPLAAPPRARSGTERPSLPLALEGVVEVAGEMKQLISSRTLAFPAGVEVEVKSRKVKVTGPRGAWGGAAEASWAMQDALVEL